MPKLYNGSVRRGNAQGNKNSKCITFSSPKLKELVKAMPSHEPTLTGTGSVAHSGSVPEAYRVDSCYTDSASGIHHTPVGDRTVLLQLAPFQPTFAPELGKTMFWCTACHNWIVTVRQFTPKPKDPPAHTKETYNFDGTKMHRQVSKI